MDGDTVVVARQGKETIVRLDSIDCPEGTQPWGDIATYGLIKMIGGKEIYLKEHGIDIHQRILATIYVQSQSNEGWLNVNERMVTFRACMGNA